MPKSTGLFYGILCQRKARMMIVRPWETQDSALYKIVHAVMAPCTQPPGIAYLRSFPRPSVKQVMKLDVRCARANGTAFLTSRRFSCLELFPV